MPTLCREPKERSAPKMRGPSRRLRALLVSGLSLFFACSGEEPRPVAGPEPTSAPRGPVASVAQALAGKDGAASITLANQIVNRYAAVAADIAPGDKSIRVTGLTTLNVSAGDLLMVIQMQGATLDFTDTVTYGEVINYNGAGRYEFVTVTGVDMAAGAVQVSSCGGGVRNAYRAAGRTQVVRVPQFTTLTIGATGSITATAWNGSIGGIVAVHAQTAMTLNGNVDVTGRGFRPGLLDNMTTNPGMAMPIFRSTSAAAGGEKGEGIGGYSADYDASGGRYGRGAPANGGGGGNAHNAGGGGGANAATRPWRRGQGVMDGAAAGGAMAWLLDPGYMANGNQLTTDGGGGRGGYTYGATDQDARTVGPGNAAWGGDSRREVGGLGGRPLDSGVTQRLFLGGGGGAGDGNNDAANQGGAGGGLVFLASPMVSGTGQVIASGENAPPTRGANNDAPGGGGGGGTVVIAAQALGGIRVTANGGRGGQQLALANESEGPGGGGGGGFIALSGGTVTTSVTGGKSGTSLSTAVTEFPVNGGTDGNSGIDTASAAALVPLIPMLDCSPNQADLQVTITDNLNGGGVVAGGTVQYTVTFQNGSMTAVRAASISDTIPPGIPPQTLKWTCTATGGATCPAPMGTGSIPPSQADLPAGASLRFVVDVPVPTGATGFFTYSSQIQPPIDISDPNPANNQASRSTPVDSNQPVSTADLGVRLVRSPMMVQAGQAVTYTTDVNNAGPDAATGVQVTITLPPGSTVQAAPSGMGWSCLPTGSLTYVCNLASLAANMSAPSITAVVLAPASLGSLVAISSVKAFKNSDPVPANNTAISSLNTASNADLSITISKSPQSAMPGAPTTYTVDVNNSGPDTVKDPSVTLTLPSGATVIMEPAGAGWTCVKGSGTTYTCTRTDLAPGAAPPITAQIATPLPPDQGGPAPTVIGLVGAPTLQDPEPANNLAVVDAAGAKVRSSDLALAITKTPDPSTLGTETTYSLQLTNKGPDAALLAVLSYSLPPGSVVTSFMPGAGWSCVQSGLSFTCVQAEVAVGDATPVVIKAITQPPADGNAGSVVGSVSAVQGRDPDPLNNFASVSAGNAAMTAADLAVTLTRTPENPDEGAEVTYRLLATNRGDAPVDGVVVTLRIPDGAEVLRTDFGDWTCQRSLSTFTCTRPRLLPGDAPAILVTVRVPASGDNDVLLGVGGAVATVGSSSNSDPDPSNNVANLGGVVYRLNGGGFSCGCSVGGVAATVPAAAWGLVALPFLIRRRRGRRSQPAG
ncbi:MAG: DUF11 domain-containing protein [Polyangia bacterium]